ncbi:phosphodiester glycosidase family protein [Streptomyces sp. NPDC051940]|uniref:phosphodiester glycosidase family protein n=1 Tax=Streptomyces sp. NPDC051940 TaxID=3155675 RepID=UPI00341941B7
MHRRGTSRSILAAVGAFAALSSAAPAAVAADDPGARLSAGTQIASGVEYRSFTFPASHGDVTGHLVTVDLSDPHVTTDLLHPGAVGASAPVTRMADTGGAIAAVNGDFFNITESQHPGVQATNAPVGPEIAGGHELKGAVPNAQRFGPALPPGTSTRDVIGVGMDRRARLDTLQLKGTVLTPAGSLPLAGLNQYALPVGGIGAFTSDWGTTSRVRSTCGSDTRRADPCSTDVYEVRVRRGRVESASAVIGGGPIAPDTTVLVGREAGAQELREFGVGEPVEVLSHLDAEGVVPLKFAVGGYPIARGGQPLAGLDTVTAAGRSAAGFGADGERLFLLSLDGNAETSAGLTISELAALLLDVGATDAVNLDGGGSSTLAVRAPGATAATAVNRPPGSFERPVPNAIGVFTQP